MSRSTIACGKYNQSPGRIAGTFVHAGGRTWRPGRIAIGPDYVYMTAFRYICRMNSAPPPFPTLRIVVTGIVQGVGFRPYVYRLAAACGLTGAVRNNGRGVEIDVQGERTQEFLRRLPREAPPLVLITDIHAEEYPASAFTSFTIIPSDGGPVTSAMIPADAATCEDCLRELRDPLDRRYRYPFINCTNCGPRYTITQSIPYDRPFTSMRAFPLCARCAAEYHDPMDRRFHAQPNACPDCGPRLRWHRNARLHGDDVDIEGDAALRTAVRDLRAGRIVAIRGLGGYHLAVDARNETAVHLLRLRKHRYEKPLAVMFRDLDAVRACCELDDVEAALLTSPRRPAVILRRRPDCDIARSVSLDNPTLGVLLPYTPLHHLILDDVDTALVMTSGNVSEEPICTGIDEAEDRLAQIADGFLHHDREILQRCDDSVFRVIAGVPRPVRRARGFVPRPVLLPADALPVIAVGAELKNTLCVTKGRAAFLSPHIGDLENLETLRFFEEVLAHLLRIYAIEPRAIVHDLHPDYLGTHWATGRITGALAERFAALPRITVQHHHAHLAACLADADHDGDAIGVILDGTGYGTDGTIWGGEFLVGNAARYVRAGHFAPLPMPGGARVPREPWRMAFAALHAAFGADATAALPAWTARRSTAEIDAVSFALAGGGNAPRTSSCGRLFDAVASLAGLADIAHFEAQAAIALEFAASDLPLPPYSFSVDTPDRTTTVTSAASATAETRATAETHATSAEHTVRAAAVGIPIVLSFLPAFEEIIQDTRIGKSVVEISTRFHAAVIAGCVEMVDRIAATTGIRAVALSGGSFQNAILLEGLQAALRARRYVVLSHSQVPCNDGGIALGQAVIAHAQWKG